jgi:hypothetical protein
MTDEINIHATSGDTTEVIMPTAKAGGYLAFYTSHKDTTSGAPYWLQLSPPHDASLSRNPYTTPYPLMTKDEAIAQASKAMPNGGTLKLVKVTL